MTDPNSLIGKTFEKDGERWTVARRIYFPIRGPETRVWCVWLETGHERWIPLSWFDDAKEVA